MSVEKSWVLEFSSPEMRQPHQVSFNGEVIIGRGGPGIEVGLDLGPYSALTKGVSRQHIRIAGTGDDLYITDLDTANGTMLNGKRLQPSKRYRLATGDEMSLGTLKLKLRVIGAPSMENVIPLQTNIGAERDDPPGNGELVLIVEDHVEIAQLFSMMLQRNGFITQVSRSGKQGLELLKVNRPHAVVLDLMLPDMDGADVCRQLRLDSTYDAIPVVVVTAKDEIGLEAALRTAGADLVLQKPVNGAELANVIAEYIQRRGTPTNVARGMQVKSEDATKALDEARVNLPQSPAAVSADTVAVIVAGYTDKPLTLAVARPISFGRAEGNPSKHVNLGPFESKSRGVSRMHAIMSYIDGNFYIEDQNSVNGTFLSGKQIPPGTPQPLFSGQEIRLGQLSMYVYFLSQELDHVTVEPVDVEEAAEDDTGMLDPAALDGFGAYDDPERTIRTNEDIYSPNEFFADPSRSPQQPDEPTTDEVDE